MTQRIFLSLMVVASFMLILTFSAFRPSANAGIIDLPKTGQTTSYTSGDDGDLQTGVAWPSPRFTNPDGSTPVSGNVILDQLTGIYWQRDGNASGLKNFDNGLTYCNNLSLTDNNSVAYNDFRMPNMLELESVINFGFNETSFCSGAGCSSNAAWLNDEGFQDVQDNNYWVSSAYAGVDYAGAWRINFDPAASTGFNTRPDNYDWSATYYILCAGGGAKDTPGGFPAEVRKTGQITSLRANDDGDLEWGVTAWGHLDTTPNLWRFTDNTDGTMTDNLTGLMWTKDGSLVSSLTGLDNMGITDWEKAVNFVDYMNTGQSFCSSTIGPCTVDGDCPGNASAGYCTNNPYITCNDDTECNAGTCYQKGCSSNYYQSCDTHADCPGGTNYCRSLKRCNGDTSVLCMNDGDCSAAGGTCVTTNCFDDSGCIDPGVDKDECVGVEGCVLAGGESCLPTPPNYGYTDWRLPNFKEFYESTVHFEGERMDDDLAAYGFMNVGGVPTTQPGRGCGIWTSTTDPVDSTRVYSSSFGWAAGMIRSYPKDTANTVFCGVGAQYPYIVWPVRTTKPNISVTPSPYNYGDVVQGTESDVTFIVNNIGDGDLSIINIAQNDTIDLPFSLVAGQDNCSATIVAPSASCTFDVRFSPIGRGAYNDTFDIASNDPDTGAFIVSISGTGRTAYVIELPQTGQTTSYSIGDDGDIMAGVAWPDPRFTNPDGSTPVSGNVVLDQLTGLFWERNGNAAGLVNYDNATNHCEGLNLDSYSDFRPPNILELESLTHAGQADSAAWLNTQGFQNVLADNYWVSENYGNYVNYGWLMHLGTAETLIEQPHTATHGVLCVRGGANEANDPAYPANVRKTGATTSWETYDDAWYQWGVTAWDEGRFTDNLDGTITDNLTGLMWTQSGNIGSTIGAGGAVGNIHIFENTLDLIDDMNTGNYGRCVIDTGNLPRCYPYENSCGPGNNQPCPIPKTDCPTDLTCVGAKEADPWNSWPVTGAAYGTCQRPTIDILCNLSSDCPEIIGGENPGTYDNLCVTIPNYGHTDWRLPNINELHASMTHWEDERSNLDLEAYGFDLSANGSCGIWSSTTDPADPNQVYSTSFQWGGNMKRKYPKDTTGLNACGLYEGAHNPIYVWPVRTAPAPSLVPDISITPSSYDFGNVAVGVTSNTVFTVQNLGSGDLNITSVSISSSDFSVQSEDCTTLSPLAQNATCSISMDFTPSAEIAIAEDLSVISNDPDTPALTAGLTGTGIPAIIDLELSKTVDNPSPVVGSTVLFTLAVTNNGPADATGVSVEDVVPNGYSTIQNISNGGTETAGTITWSSLSITNGATVNLTFNVDVNASGNYINVAQVTAADLNDSDSTPDNDNGDQSEDDEDNASTSPVAVIIDLSLYKTTDNSSPFVGDTVTFTLAVTNSGPSDATGVEVKDVVPDGFSNIQNINFGGTEAGDTITWSGLNINSGVTRNLKYTSKVHGSGNYTNVAQVTAADQPDSDSSPNNDDGDQSEDDEDNQSVVPVFGIDLELDKSVNNPSPDMGSTVTFSIDVTNKGYLDATGVTVQDVVPDGYSNIQNISNGGTEAGGIITWSGLNINMGSVDWYDTGWNYRQKITINSTQVPGDLTNFPVLINIIDPNLIVSPGGNIGKANGGDILFTNAHGTQKFDHEIESYSSATGELVAWVMLPEVSSTMDTIIYMYYGNAGAADQWNTNATWDSNYVDVLHFTEEQAGTANLGLYKDSTANNNHGDDHVSATGQEGKIGRGQEFDGVDDYVSVADNSSLDITDELTLEVWVKSTTILHQVVVDKRDIVRNPPGWWRFSMGDTGLSFQVSNTNWFYVDWPNSIIDNTWHHVTGVMNGKIQIYVDGILRNEVNNVVGTMTTNDAPLLIGKWIGDLAFYEGFIDEIRISNIARSAEWIETSFNNQNTPSSFTSYDAEEVYNPASASAITLTFDADVTVSGNYLNVAQVTAADQPDSDSAPNNDNGDQSEDDEDNAIIVLPGSSYSLMNQPRTTPGDPYPCNLWYTWCDPARGGSWPSNAVYAASWDDVNITGGGKQVLAEHFNVKVETTITEIKIWGGYWWQDTAPATDNFTLIVHNDAGGTIGTMVSELAYTLNRFDTGIHVPMPYSATQSGNSLIFEYTFTLTETLTLAPGTYWIEIFNDTTGHTNNNDFFWMWGYLDNIDGRGIDGLAWTGQLNAGGSGTSWSVDTEGNLAIEINGQADGCTLRVKNVDTFAEYCTIQEAYNDADENETETIHVKAESFTETLDFNMGKSVTILGGYDDTYSIANGNTTLNGNVTSSNGRVTMGNFILD